jgi:hypothetical protein
MFVAVAQDAQRAGAVEVFLEAHELRRARVGRPVADAERDGARREVRESR